MPDAEGEQPLPRDWDGFVLVDKPQGLTSHDVVARVRRALGTRKVGHAGTLDPMATGLLVVGVNRATRLLTYVVGADKTYTATIRLGQTTATEDAEGAILQTTDACALTPAQIEAAAARLTGDLDQIPSAVSAIKVDGVRSYARVRRGEEVELAARRVRVDRFDIGAVRPAGEVVDVDVVVECSSGTYVRALARDLGDDLGVGGHLVALRRTRVGPFDVADASAIDDMGSAGLPIAAAARAILATRELGDDEVRELGFGRRIAGECGGTPERPVAAFAPDGTLVAVLADDDGRSRPVVVFAPV